MIQIRWRAAVHAGAVVAGYTALFAWLFAYAPLHAQYLSESDLFEYYLPIFLAPVTLWSPYEFSGLPAFADPGDFTLYPAYVVARLAGSWTALVASAFVLAAVFTYAYVYRLTRSWRAAAFAGLAYGLSEAMLERTPHLGTLHAFAWLPLILLAIEELDGPARRRWAAVGGLAIGCCILAGHPQPAVYTSYAALAYAAVRGWRLRDRSRYYITVVAMFALGGALASAKLLPLVEASFLMARQVVNFGQFAAHSNSPAQMLSALFPTVLHEGREAPTYVGLSTLMLAMLGAATAWRRWEAMFWITVSLVALLLGMGAATPLASIAYSVIPLYDKFRGTGRHLFLFALGTSILAGLAIDAIERGQVTRRTLVRSVLAVTLFVAAGAALLALLPSAFEYEVRADLPWALPIWNSGVWVQLGLLGLSAFVVALLQTAQALRLGIGGVAVVLLLDTLYALPYPVSAQGIVPIAIASDIVRPNAHALQLARDMKQQQQRALATAGTARDPVVPAAFARLWRVPIAGAYGPMLLDRYSQLAMMGTSGAVRPSLFATSDAGLDLLAVRYVVIGKDELADPATFTIGGVTWAVPPLAIPVGRPDCGHAYPRQLSLPLPRRADIAAIALVTHLSCADHVPQGTEVARLKLVGPSGVLGELPLRAGMETAERALANPTVRAVAKHQPGILFEDPEHDGGYRYVATWKLPVAGMADRLEIAAAGFGGWLTIDRLTTVDAAGGAHADSVPGLWLADRDRWRALRHIRTSRNTDRDVQEERPDEQPYVIVENLRALPRTWVVGEVVGLTEYDAVETVRRSQFPDGRLFDPRHAAIVDADSKPLPMRLSPGRSSAAVAELQNDRIVVDVTTEGAGFLVLSDAWYPGWQVRVDGMPATLYRADVALRGVPVPPGRHRVAFELVSTTWRVGVALSAAAVAAALGLCMWPSRRRLPVA
jgi:hypothetical protein